MPRKLALGQSVFISLSLAVADSRNGQKWGQFVRRTESSVRLEVLPLVLQLIVTSPGSLLHERSMR